VTRWPTHGLHSSDTAPDLSNPNMLQCTSPEHFFPCDSNMMACSSLLLTPTCRMQLPFSPPPVQSIARQLLPRSCVFTCQMQFFSPPPPVFSHVKCSFFLHHLFNQLHANSCLAPLFSHVKRSFFSTTCSINCTPAPASLLLCFVRHRPLVRVWVPS
jgi:hypothetical protein